MAKNNDNVINARPTKRLVVYVITKDIKLEDAILDLVDNSIDGARRIATGSLKRFHVEIEFDEEHFKIRDNCGGMSREMARTYAFRFGRPEDYAPGPDEQIPYQIGNFGIGMKRALLKMGRDITVESRTKEEFFKVRIDVPKWLQDDSSDQAWTFSFAQQGEESSPADRVGTTIEVRSLYKGVSERFALETFETDCGLLIREKQSLAMASGMGITVNGKNIAAIQLTLLQSAKIRPIFKQARHGDVTVRLYAGIGEQSNAESGWTVVCNGRTILRNDKSATTGWGYEENGDRIPAYHNQYARFRGYVFFDSDKPDALPWNTTKTGVDAEHPLYRQYYLEMVAAMKAVFQFLKDLDAEKDATKKPLEDKVENAKAVPLNVVKRSATFVRPAPGTVSSPARALTWIRYQRKTKDVSRVMKSLDVESPHDAGGATFDIYLNSEKRK